MTFLLQWIIRSAIFIAAGAVLLWALRVKDASTRAVAWTALLCGSWLIAALTLPVPGAALPRTFFPTFKRTEPGVIVRPAAVPAAAVVSAPAPTRASIPPPEPPRPETPFSSAASNAVPAARLLDWARAVLFLYAAVCCVLLLRLCAGLVFGIRLLRHSSATGRTAGGIEIRESSDLAAPVALGILRPAIVLPEDWREWDSARLTAVLAHERSHVQRRDPWIQLLSGLHRAILWASPLSWFLHRRIVESAEEASDDAAVAAVRDRTGYAETLLDFMRRGVLNSHAAGVSMARHGSPEKRIRRILDATLPSGGITARAVMAVAAVVSPLAYMIATAQPQPQFDIADVHLSATAGGPNSQMLGGGIRAGIFQIQNATMVDLIRTAYGVDAKKVVGGPSWLELDRYEVFAKAPASTSVDTAKLMLQALLADRFKLAIHKDTRLLPGFALTVAKGAEPKLKKAAGSGPSGCKFTQQFTDADFAARRQALREAGKNPYILQVYLFDCENMTMAAFAGQLRSMPGAQQPFNSNGQPNLDTVVDRTGLGGEWDFKFKLTSPVPAAAAGAEIDGEPITIFDALEKQLGLKLTAAKVPTPVLVVDSVNRKPTDNPPDMKTILAPPPPPEFEAADLKMSPPNAPEVRSRGPMPGGRFEVNNFPLTFLIMMGWQLPTNGALTGKPAWLDAARVDLIAKLPATDSTRAVTGVTDMDAFVPALRALLTERFKIAIHTEERPVPGYALVAAKPKMRKADPTLRTKCFEGPGADGKDPRKSSPLLSRLVTCQNITMAEFVKQLPSLSGGYIRNEPLMDGSGLAGAYDFTLSFTGTRIPAAQAAIGLLAGPPEAADPDGLTLFVALEKQLGVKLEKRNIPTPVVILDHIDEKPAGN